MWGHYWMGLSLSMFSVVGLIGMSGIIINDSIVLVTTIDEYAEKRGRIPSIIDGATDRLRAVLLTTMTTVGGLTPLLFETSRQALFLKPTVVTLAFGLGFGVVLVLLVTPSIMAVEHDIRMALNSLRHMLRLRGGSWRSGAGARPPDAVARPARSNWGGGTGRRRRFRRRRSKGYSERIQAVRKDLRWVHSCRSVKRKAVAMPRGGTRRAIAGCSPQCPPRAGRSGRYARRDERAWSRPTTPSDRGGRRGRGGRGSRYGSLAPLRLGGADVLGPA